jgi:hypothetical protein
MSHSSERRWTCDACRESAIGPGDELPRGWSYLSIQTDEERGAHALDLCGSCIDAVRGVLRLRAKVRAA